MERTYESCQAGASGEFRMRGANETQARCKGGAREVMDV